MAVKKTEQNKSTALMPIESVEQKIYIIRGQRIMIDADLAEVYGVEARVLNQAVKRNAQRFPEDLMFQLTDDEFAVLRNSSQFVTSSRKHRVAKYRPYAFTEHAAVMLASVLNSPLAIEGRKQKVKVMSYLISALVFSLLFISFVQGQTASDIEKLFSKTEEANQYTHKGVSITVRFDKDGQVCKAVFPSKSYSNNVITVGISEIKGEEIKEILNLVAPPAIRGKTIWSLLNSNIYGRMGDTEYEYENVLVTTYFAFELKGDEFNNEKKESNATLVTDETMQSDKPNEVSDSEKEKRKKIDIKNWLEEKRKAEEILSADVAVITWKNRQCVE